MASTPTISFSGLASGLDTTSIINQLTATAQLPITHLNTQISGYNTALSDWQNLNTGLASLQSAVSALSNQSNYDIPAASSSNTAVATITTQIGATLGDHSLTVTQLAQAQKVVSSSVSSSSTALGQSGTFIVNGKTVHVNSNDALADVAGKINAAGAGVTATVVNVGTNDFRLTLTSTKTGTVNSIAAADSNGAVLSSLGLIQSGTAGIRQSISYAQGGALYAGAASLTLGSATQSIGALLGIAAGSAPSGAFHLSNGATGTGNAADISVNLNTDSLTDIANAINQSGIVGVSAEVVTVPDANGNLNRIHQLRIVSSNQVAATASTATSTGQTLTAGDVFGGSLTVNGQAVSLAGNGNTIAQLQAAIQATPGNAGVTASLSAGNKLVLTDPSGNPITATLSSLHNFTGTTDNGALGAPAIANGAPASATPPTFTDTSGILTTTGILQNQFTQTVTAAQDAKFNIDGLDLRRSTNTVNDVISGASIALLSGSAATPGTTNLSVSQNTASVIQAVNTFTSAYNAVQDYIANENKFTPPTITAAGATGTNPPLFGSATLIQIQQQLSQALTAVSGTNTLQSIGVTLNGTGDLAVDSTALATALQANPNAVSDLFGLSGTSDSSDIQFIKGSAKSAASTGAGYDVNITQPATQSTGTAGTASAAGATSASPETLTFGGSLFPTALKLTIPTGSTVQQTAALINSTSSLNSQIYATVDSGNHLVIASQKYGSGNSFTASSDSPASGTNSGIGASLGITSGVDVIGTINGEAATGSGRTLSGAIGDAHAEGVQLLVTATTPSPTGSSTGHITITHGVADGLSSTLTQILDPINGSVVSQENGLNSQVSAAQAQITQVQKTVTTYTGYLTQLFSDMETRVSELQAQGSAFSAAFGGSTSSSTTSSSSGSTKSSSG